MAGNLGTAMLFEAVSARAGRLSSAAAENLKDHCRPPQAENLPERKFASSVKLLPKIFSAGSKKQKA
jgi:hypothetical protein